MQTCIWLEMQQSMLSVTILESARTRTKQRIFSGLLSSPWVKVCTTIITLRRHRHDYLISADKSTLDGGLFEP
jgi:hypothetical protein